MTPMRRKKSAPQKGRTQTERSTETRQKIIQAAVRIISESGFKKASLGQIAAEAGVTTGAIQHHFGDKAGILFAVIEMSFGQLSTSISTLNIEKEDMEHRITQFIEIIWGGYSDPLYWTSLEIIMNMKNDCEFTERVRSYMSRIKSFIDRMWMGTFWDTPASREHHIAAWRFLFNTLNGLAIERMTSPDTHETKKVFALLNMVITQLLSKNPPALLE